jgi:hypothetical protein
MRRRGKCKRAEKVTVSHKVTVTSAPLEYLRRKMGQGKRMRRIFNFEYSTAG